MSRLLSSANLVTAPAGDAWSIALQPYRFTCNAFIRHSEPLPFPLLWWMIPSDHCLLTKDPAENTTASHPQDPTDTSKWPPLTVWPRKRDTQHTAWGWWLASGRGTQFTIYCSCDYYWTGPRKAPTFWHVSDFPVCTKSCQEHRLKQFLSFFQDLNYAPNIVEMSPGTKASNIQIWFCLQMD